MLISHFPLQGAALAALFGRPFPAGIRARPEITGCASKRFRENQPVFGFSRTAMLGRSHSQGSHDFIWNVADGKLSQ